MKRETWPIERVTPYDNNPRKNDDAVDAVADSIKTYGWRAPILVDKDGVIIAGHTRLKAAKQLKLKKVPVAIADDMTPEQVRKFRIADNRSGELSSWDTDKLRDELNDLGNLQDGLTHLEFNDEDLDAIIGDDLPDDLFADAPDNSDNSDSNDADSDIKYLTWGEAKVPITDNELSKLNAKYDEYQSSKAETSFVNWLLSGGQ